jgi:hypothetical protein
MEDFMILGRLTIRGSAALTAATLLAACAARGTSTLPAASSSFVPSVTREAKLPACKGQQTTKQYATLTVTLSTDGGSFCIPKFGGFGGSVKYPSANPSVDVTLWSSTTNYNHMPELGNGTAIFYLQLALSGGTNFGSKVGHGGGLASKKIVPGQTYTVFGQAKIYGFPYNFNPCYVIAVKSRYGGTLGGIGTLLKGQSVPAPATGVIEIYGGQQASQEC